MYPAAVRANPALCAKFRGVQDETRRETQAHLERDVPSTPREAEDHACGEEDAPDGDLEENVEP